MILFTERATYINMLHGHMVPKLSVQHLGSIQHRLSDGQWLARFTGRNLEWFSDHLDGSEKRAIIGMLDKLNGITGRDQGDSERRWNEIIGLKEPSYKVHCCDDCGAKWRSDNNGDICNCGKSAIRL